jgi:hypothetical protein
MNDREVIIPKFLHELHGEKTRLSNLIIVYLSGVLAASVIFYTFFRSGTELWKVLLITLLYLDIAGGVVANFSSSTIRYYSDKGVLRVYFLLTHLLHPALFIVAFHANWLYFTFTGLYTIAVSLFVNSLKEGEMQKNLATLFVTSGILISFFFKVPNYILYSFAPLFMIKLILGFSIKKSEIQISK